MEFVKEIYEYKKYAAHPLERSHIKKSSCINDYFT